jgi:predicted ATP-grasp superfamily ATP-dependent carboligase
MRNILVLDCHLSHALVVIQSLGRAGYRILAASDHDEPIGHSSRFVQVRHACPDISKDVHGFGDWLRRVLCEEQVDLVIPVSDRSGRALVEVEHSLPSETKLALPPRPAYLRSLDKLDTLQSAARLGVPAPRFCHWRAGTVLAPDAELPPYPIVLKPRSSVLYHDNRLHFPRVSYAVDRAELEKRAATYGEHCDLLLQERVRGEGVGVELLRLPGGELHTVFQHRRVREMPLTGGGSTCRVAESVDAKLLAYAGSLLDDLDWTGVAMVEFKTGHDGDSLMEINGRFWGSLALAVDAGVDFPRLLAAMHLGETMPPRADYRVGHRSIKIPADLNWIAEVIQGRGLPLGLKRRHALQALVGYLTPWQRSFDGVTWTDPRPGLVMLGDTCKRFLLRR